MRRMLTRAPQLAATLLISSPPALTLAQITQAASGDAFERLISKTISWSYAVLTPPLTLLYVSGIRDQARSRIPDAAAVSGRAWSAVWQALVRLTRKGAYSIVQDDRRLEACS